LEKRAVKPDSPPFTVFAMEFSMIMKNAREIDSD
jgi:hypothetical protein